LPLTRWLTHTTPTAVFVVLAFAVGLVVDDAVHVVPLAVNHVVVDAEAGSPAGTATLAFVVPGQGIATGESAAALGTCVWAFSGVKFRVAFQVMQTAETCLAGGARVGLLLAVGEEMALEIVMAREVGGAVRAFVSLC